MLLFLKDNNNNNPKFRVRNIILNRLLNLLTIKKILFIPSKATLH